MFDRGRTPHPGILLGILGVVVPPGSPNPDPVLTKKSYFSHRFQTWLLKSIPVFRPGKGRTVMLSLLRLERQRNVFLKSISNSHLSLSFLLTPHKNHSLWGGTYLFDICKEVTPASPPPPRLHTALKGQNTFHLLRCRSMKMAVLPVFNPGGNRYKTVCIATWLALLGEHRPPVRWAEGGWFKPRLDQHSGPLNKSKCPRQRDPWIFQNYLTRLLNKHRGKRKIRVVSLHWLTM